MAHSADYQCGNSQRAAVTTGFAETTVFSVVFFLRVIGTYVLIIKIITKYIDIEMVCKYNLSQ